MRKSKQKSKTPDEGLKISASSIKLGTANLDPSVGFSMMLLGMTEIDAGDGDDVEDDTKWYLLEVRFPSKNLYPWEPPVVAFSSTHPDFKSAVCLNITKRLAAEAVEQASSGSPAVFSLVSILEDEDEMNVLLDQKPLKFLSRSSDTRTKEPEDVEAEVVDLEDEASEDVGPDYEAENDQAFCQCSSRYRHRG